MPLVTVRGRIYDHAQIPFPPDVVPELTFRPNADQPTRESGGLLVGVEVHPEFFSTGEGSFAVDLYSDGTTRVSYTPVLRWLVDTGTAPGEREARGYAEFPPFYPDNGGNIAVLYRNQGLGLGTGYVLVATSAPDQAQPYQIQLNPNTWDLYERRVV